MTAALWLLTSAVLVFWVLVRPWEQDFCVWDALLATVLAAQVWIARLESARFLPDRRSGGTS